jgi:hypothetical protein
MSGKVEQGEEVISGYKDVLCTYQPAQILDLVMHPDQLLGSRLLFRGRAVTVKAMLK